MNFSEQKIIETKWVKVWLGRDGIIYLVDIGAEEVNLTSAQEIWGAVDQVRIGQVRPILADIRKSKPPKLEARKYFSRNEIHSLINAVALLIRSPLSRVIGSLFLGLNILPVPIKLFSSKEDATEWLKGFVE